MKSTAIPIARWSLLGIEAMLLLLCSAISHAQQLLPVKTKNMNPFMIGYGAVMPDSPFLVRHDEWITSIKLELANNSITANTTTEEVTIDGESYIADINLRYGYRNNLELLIGVPLVYHSGGFLDQTIKNWHNLWGMSNARRDVFPNSQLRYQYKKDGATLIDINTGTGGLGDVTIGIKFNNEKLRSGATAIAYRLDLKLPTGDADKLTGSGATDAAFSLHAANSTVLSHLNSILYGGAGLVALGKSDILPDIQKELSASGYIGASWYVTHRLALIAQLNYQSAYYESNLDQLGSDSIQLYLNAAYTDRNNISYEVGFGENLTTDPTPDFLLYFSVTTRYWGRY
ncbi:DUF3187 family protein [Kaarinaea lacus]